MCRTIARVRSELTTFGLNRYRWWNGCLNFRAIIICSSSESFEVWLLHGDVGAGQVSNGLTDEDGKARERKTAGDVVDYIYLTEVQARFQRLQRQVQLEGYGFAFWGVHFVKGGHAGLEDLRGVLDKFYIGENANGVVRRLRSWT